MASPDFYTTLQTTKTRLLDISATYTNYAQSLASQQGSITQGGDMEESVASLTKELKSLQVANETYDREYQDRVKSEATKIHHPGLQTTQDYLLAYFFGSYFLLVILLTLYMIVRTKNKLRNAVTVFVTGTVFGLITAYILLLLA